jgi:rod shape-determining protein MreC
MRNLFLFLWRNYFFLLFVLLEMVCFLLMVKNNNYQNASVLNSTNKIVARVYRGVNSVTQYIHLADNNEHLAEENARLRALLPASFYDTSIIRSSKMDTLLNLQYTFIDARVINNSTNRRNNYLTLAKGSNAGIKSEMGVISANGIVGIVKDVSPHYCTVKSFLNTESKVSVRFKNNTYNGSMIWESENSPLEATVIDIPRHVLFKPGDTLVTTTFSPYFPEGVMVGTVQSSNVIPGSNSFTITVNLSTNFSNISHVYVVNNLLKGERKQLEDKITDAPRNN